MKISVLVVTLNAGDALKKTINSILSQKDALFEIIVKDGGSSDGSIDGLPDDERIRLIVEKDNGIYDAMNQAAQYADGEYALYLNCGDLFYNDTVLKSIKEKINTTRQRSCDDRLYYGDCYTANRGYVLRYPQKFDDYVCFTKVLCHQATVYPTSLLKLRPFSDGYKIAADYEYYVYSYKNGYRLTHIPVVIASYEGNGASEKTENRRLALEERKRALKTHFSKADYRKNWWKVQLRGVGIKQFLVKIEWLYPAYRKLAKFYYSFTARKYD